MNLPPLMPLNGKGRELADTEWEAFAHRIADSTRQLAPIGTSHIRYLSVHCQVLRQPASAGMKIGQALDRSLPYHLRGVLCRHADLLIWCH